MLSYRHAYHAGNHADVLKHACLCLLLQTLRQKDKALTYIDTHAAAGLYSLKGEMAQKNREFHSGIERLLAYPAPSPLLEDYYTLIANFREQNLYPGSPTIAARMLRAQDRLVLIERHNTEIEVLKRHLAADKRTAIHHRDAFEAALALCPPTPRRGVMLIDPPYEQASEYDAVVNLLGKLQSKWPVGVYCLWYPLLARRRDQSERLLKNLVKLQPPNVFIAELQVEKQNEDTGMYGSGMAFINLPWKMDELIIELLKQLNRILGAEAGRFRSDWLIPKT